ncbi:hypothetical protein VTJ49DRAFT_2909 [Mycothermus thermophilus]|uniref:Uncharacterized protein n=1 Tax=Humicola insolens TaxID=85995 RepID=A0ABR3VMP0_HUMIN
MDPFLGRVVQLFKSLTAVWLCTKPRRLTNVLGRCQRPRHWPQQRFRLCEVHQRGRCAESHLGHEQYRVSRRPRGSLLSKPGGQIVVNMSRRFDGRQIRVDKASDTGPKGGRGGGSAGYARGGYAPPFGGTPIVASPMTGSPMTGSPVPGIAYGSQPPYGISPTMYHHQPYGRGYAPMAPAAYAVPPQGAWREKQSLRGNNKPTKANSSTAAWAPQPYGYPDPSQQGQPPQPPTQSPGQGGY